MRLLAVGDVWSARPAPWPGFSLVGDLLAEGDVRFGNCEGVYGDDADRLDISPLPLLAPRAAAEGLRDGRFDVMSCANNHIFDGGVPGLRSTLEALGGLGVAAVGAGEDAAQAVRPAVIGAQGASLAFLAYSAAHPAGYAATARRPGLSAIRVDPPDLERLAAGVAQARRLADHVVVSAHWGAGLRPWLVHDHEQRLARQAIAAGADAVLCHHHHCLRGVEVHVGRPIFFGIGHFAFEIAGFDARAGADLLAALREREGEYAMFERPGFPLLPFHPDARRTLIASVTFEHGRVTAAGFVPCRIEPDGRVAPLDARAGDGAAVVEWVRRASRRAGADPELRVGGDAVGGMAVVEFLRRHG